MGRKTYANDEAGARITKIDGTIHWTYQYDGESRLVKALNNGVMVTENTYDGSGMRVKKIADGKTVYFVYNGNDPLIEYSAIDSKYTYYVYAGKQAVAEETGGVVRYYHKDHLGSTRVVTDVSGAKVAEYTYEPFGKVIVATDNAQQYTGKKQDGTGLYYFNARFYDPEVARFVTQDICSNLPNDEKNLFGNLGLNTVIDKGFDNPQRYNRYSYCLNNPLKYNDPDGRYAIVAVPVAVAVVAVLVTAALLGSPPAQKALNEIGKAIDKAISDAQTSINSSNSKSKSKPTSNPFTGDPGSTSTTYDEDGNVKQVRKYGPDGYPAEDTDYDHDHNQGKPHTHKWGRPKDGGPPSDKDRGTGEPTNENSNSSNNGYWG
jgi:RHS repeat-associated protein